MEIINLGKNNSILNGFIAQMRDKTVQKDSMRFRTNLERVGAIFAYEISKRLNYSEKKVATPLGIADVNTPDDQIVVATILRAGLPLHNGILNFFDNAQNAFVAAYRKYDKGDDFHINIEYVTAPDLDGKVRLEVEGIAEGEEAACHQLVTDLQKGVGDEIDFVMTDWGRAAGIDSEAKVAIREQIRTQEKTRDRQKNG